MTGGSISRVALVIVSGGKPFEFEEMFQKKGFGLRAVASHRIEFTAHTFPFGRRVDRAVFTSRNGVAAVVRAGLGFLENATIDAVGPATIDALAAAEIAARLPANIASVAALLEALPPSLDGEFVFWPRGDDSDFEFARELERRGANVYAPVVYKKVALDFPADLAAAIRSETFGAFACTSPAAVKWLFSNLDRPEREIIASLPAAALGTATKDAFLSSGAASVSVSEEATFESLAETLCRCLERAAGDRLEV